MAKRPIYLDYMATTPVDPRIIDKMVNYLGPEANFGNSASITHIYGLKAAEAIEKAREQIASVIHASPQEIVFTSGATEADNLAIIGAARFYQRKGRHIITLRTEHKAVLDSFQQLEKEGFKVTYLPVRADGLLDPETLKTALTAETILVSVMHVNNEIGIIQDIKTIGEILRDRGIIFHVDAAQSAGKLSIDLRDLPVDLMALSAHKNYGPKGIGVLYVRHKPKRIRLQPQSFGGGQEGGVRAGTLPTHQIVAMSEAFALSEELREEEQAQLLELRQHLWQGIKSIPGIRLNGHEHRRVAGNLNISFAGIDGESLLYTLRELAISKTSACAAASMQPSYVLQALGLSDELAYGSVRISLGRFTTLAEIDKTIAIINTQIRRLQEIAPNDV